MKWSRPRIRGEERRARKSARKTDQMRTVIAIAMIMLTSPDPDPVPNPKTAISTSTKTGTGPESLSGYSLHWLLSIPVVLPRDMWKLRHEGPRKRVVRGDIHEAEIARCRFEEQQVRLGFRVAWVMDDEVEEDKDCGDGEDG
jgi:hypothetical protein